MFFVFLANLEIFDFHLNFKICEIFVGRERERREKLKKIKKERCRGLVMYVLL